MNGLSGRLATAVDVRPNGSSEYPSTSSQVLSTAGLDYRTG